MNIFIFGATSGIGRELAKIYVNKGHKVAITGRREELLKEIKNETPDQYLTFRHDIRKTDEIPALLQQVKEQWGSIDLIIVNAGIGKANLELDFEKCESVIKTNVMGVTKALVESFKFFKEQGYGHLVGISSVASLIGSGINPSYNASKAYQANFLEGLWMKAQKTKKAKIFVTDIRPGFVDTRLVQGDVFWKAPVDKAAKQIFHAIRKKKKVAYITKRWWLVAVLLKCIPGRFKKFFS